MRRILIAGACAVAVALSSSSAAAASEPVEGGFYLGGEEDGPFFSHFSIVDGAVVDGFWKWTTSCTLPSSPEPVVESTEQLQMQGDGVEPVAIDSSGRFRITLQTARDEIVIEGIIDGQHATGTATSTSTYSDSDVTCRANAFPWSADTESASVDSGCIKAKAKVAKLKEQIKSAEGKRKKRLRQQLSKAKAAQKKACD